MYAVGRLGSYITQGVYTVSGPFHPFGGAVDIVVVQQEDGSLKSSPWYVRFGKFQGVLKARERVVDINVNGADADFHMYLDPRGEAYFLRESDSISPSFEDNKLPMKSKSMNCDFNPVSDNGLSRNNSKRSRILGFVLGRRSMNDQILSKEENDSNVERNMEHAEIATDLLEMKWSTNLSSRNDNNECIGGSLNSSLVLHEQHFVNKSDKVDDISLVEDLKETEVGIITAEDPSKIVEKICSEVASTQEGDEPLPVVSCNSIPLTVEDNNNNNNNEIRLQRLESNGEYHDVLGDSVLIKKVSEEFVEEQLLYGGDSNQSTSEINQTCSVSPNLKKGSYPPPIRVPQERSRGEHKESIKKSPSVVDIPKNYEAESKVVGRRTQSLPNLWYDFDDPNQQNLEDSQFYSPLTGFRTSNWDLIREDASRIKRSNLEKELNLTVPQSADSVPKDLKDDIVDGTVGSWNLWPFRILSSKTTPQKEEINKKDSEIIDTPSETDSSPQSSKFHSRALAPTPEQLASLNLAEGKNTVTFTFSTSVLGAQKVDARIYLWRWDTRIVISDVDGTITKSDVLGQFMPLVGRDWSHIGVTHLFSAIKENGYQMLYLSARAISQASITRQFLFNLKQDGEALPDGPVVISPDGLFPSLFREVIRRAPHEFKIACLEDIKACFPSNRNPFYAGFGNRDTDEFSYLKVGISLGKIFIINPKGEVVVNRCVDSKSYASLHALVNGIFPPISVHEEEDYNSWNFWKLPPPTIE